MQREDCNASFSQSISLPVLYLLTSAIIPHANMTSRGLSWYPWLMIGLVPWINHRHDITHFCNGYNYLCQKSILLFRHKVRINLIWMLVGISNTLYNRNILDSIYVSILCVYLYLWYKISSLHEKTLIVKKKKRTIIYCHSFM